jgi:hypothetical protein
MPKAPDAIISRPERLKMVSTGPRWTPIKARGDGGIEHRDDQRDHADSLRKRTCGQQNPGSWPAKPVARHLAGV